MEYLMDVHNTQPTLSGYSSAVTFLIQAHTWTSIYICSTLFPDNLSKDSTLSKVSFGS